MASLKFPNVITEHITNQKAEKYLLDLKNRFTELHRQHDAILGNSLNIMREISEFQTALNYIETKNPSKIKDLIRGFESVSGRDLTENTSSTDTLTNNGKKNFDVKKALQMFENLKGKEIIMDGLLIFKRAKGCLDKIDLFLGEISQDCKYHSHSREKSPLRNFRGKSKYPKILINDDIDLPPTFSSCYSSSESLKRFKSIEDCHSKTVIGNGKELRLIRSDNNDMGYQGDVDESEIDLHAKLKVIM